MIGKLDHFNLIAEAAGGGPWRAYRARDTVHGRTVLIKVAPAELAEPGARRERFLTAARQAALLSHPNLATVFDVGDSGDAPYLAIEFVPGETLAQVMAAGPQHVRAAVDLGIQLADALAEVHAHGLVHGDVRPETIRVSPKGNAKLLEAGLSAWTRGGRLRHPAAARAEADAAVALDTVAYFSPEQARGDAVDERSDLFSLGAVLYEMLTGVTAFRRGSVESTLASVLDTRPREPSEIDPSIPEDLDAVVRRALAKALEERFQSAASFAAELRSVAAILDIRSGDSEPPVVVERKRGGWQGAGLRAVAGTTVAVIGIGLVWWLAGDVLRRQVHQWLGPPPAAIVTVLPLEFDADASRYYADGLSEDLAVRIGQLPGVSVVGRAGMRARRGRPLAVVAEELQAAVLVRGSVRTSGDAVAVELELIDASDGSSVWRGGESGSARTILATQTMLAESVAEALGVELAPSAARARKKSLPVGEGAYDLYLRGRDAAAQQDNGRAIALYETAISDGEGFAELYAALAYALHAETGPDGAHSEPGRVRLDEVAALAAASDPDLPQAQVARGMAAGSRGEALTYYRQAVELDPSYAVPYAMIAVQLVSVDPRLSERFGARAAALDPELTKAPVAGDARVHDIDDGGGLGDSERQLLESLLERVVPGATQ